MTLHVVTSLCSSSTLDRKQACEAEVGVDERQERLQRRCQTHARSARAHVETRTPTRSLVVQTERLCRTVHNSGATRRHGMHDVWMRTDLRGLRTGSGGGGRL